MPDPVDMVVAAVCQLPIDYKSFGDRSAVALIRHSGYLAHRSEVTVDRVEACLSEHPDLVDAWFRWSEDRRGSPAWYLLAEGSTAFEIGYYDANGRSEQRRFDDRIRACAEYVIREAAHFADLA